MGAVDWGLLAVEATAVGLVLAAEVRSRRGQLLGGAAGVGLALVVRLLALPSVVAVAPALLLARRLGQQLAPWRRGLLALGLILLVLPGTSLPPDPGLLAWCVALGAASSGLALLDLRVRHRLR